MTMKFAVAAAALMVVVAGPALADGLTTEDYKYLGGTFGLTAESGVIAELTPNEQNALHSAIFDLKSYPEGQDRQVRRYLSLVYGRECKRWGEAHPGETCSPPADPSLRPGKAVSDRVCADCHLFGTQSAASFRKMANAKTWDPHKVEHALHHSPGMVPIRLTPEQLAALVAYINSFKSTP
jgi:Cytochrome C oxidase, cbb3-type, subunit III